MLITWIRAAVLPVILIGTVLLQTGCATVASAKAAKGTGYVRIYNQPYDKVWSVSLAILRSYNVTYSYHGYSNGSMQPFFKIVTEDKTEGLILAKGTVETFRANPQNMAMFITPVGVSKTRVEVVDRSTFEREKNPEWQEKILNNLDRFVGVGQVVTPVTPATPVESPLLLGKQ